MSAIKRPRFQRGSLKLTSTGWWLRYRGDDGKETRRFVGHRTQYRTQSAARVAADRLLAELNPQHQISARSVRLRECAAVYMTDAIALMKPSGARSATSLLNKHVVPLLGDMYLESIGLQAQQRFVTQLHAAGLGNKTISNAIGILARMCALARKYGFPVANIERSEMTMPPDELDHERRCFTPDESTRIIQAAEFPLRALYALYAFLGLRSGEGLGLCWQHVNFEQRLVHVRQSAVLGAIQTVKSRNSKADLPMPEPLYDLLKAYEAWLNAQGITTELLFADESGQPLNADRVRLQHFVPLLKRLGIKRGGLHAFRHGVATNLLNAGVSIHVAKSILRHGDLKTTLSYTHTVIDDQRRATDKSAALFTSGTNGNGHV
ncbi:MAG: site-specific integrase [Steroidobacteraceae bacterium]